MIHDDLTKPDGFTVDSDEVRLALNRILASRPFRNSTQCSGLLRYVVEQTLAGRENLLRERVIGAEVFGRPADYETGEDPVVRLRVSEVRKRLAQYYLSDRNDGGIQINIPPGSYVATFNRQISDPTAKVREERDPTRTTPAVEELAFSPRQDDALSSPVLPDPIDRRPAIRTGRIAFVATVVALLAILGSFAGVNMRSSERDFRAFWAPWLKSTKPIILSVGSNAVYRLQYEYVYKYAREHGLESQGAEFFIPFGKAESPSASQFVPASNSFVALADVNAVSDIVATLTKEKALFQERFPDDISFAELRSSPAVLIGGFNNSMSVELARHLEFVMRAGNEIEIDDTFKPGKKWALDVPQDLHETTDYAIITRIVNRNGDSPIIGVAGLGQYGTLAAADLICSPASLRLVTKGLPLDWASRNLQVVLRINVVDFRPSVSEVVAVRSW